MPIGCEPSHHKTLPTFFFAVYLILRVTALAAFCSNSRVSNNFIDYLIIYFACESTTPGNCEKAKSTVSMYSFSYLTDTVYIFLSLFLLVNRVYALQSSDLRTICTPCFHLIQFSRGEMCLTQHKAPKTQTLKSNAWGMDSHARKFDTDAPWNLLHGDNLMM